MGLDKMRLAHRFVGLESRSGVPEGTIVVDDA